MKSSKWDDPKWLDFSFSLKKKRGWKCEKCGYVGGDLRVHHLAYSQNKNRDPWEYHERHLVVLCATCHEKEHNIKTIPDDECLSEAKTETKIILSKHKGNIGKYEYCTATTLTKKQAETFCNILYDLNKITREKVTASTTFRFIIEIMSKFYSHSTNWVAEYDRERDFLGKRGCDIF